MHYKSRGGSESISPREISPTTRDRLLCKVRKLFRKPSEETRSAVSEDQNYCCYQYATAVGIREANPATKQVHSEHPYNNSLPVVRSEV